MYIQDDKKCIRYLKDFQYSPREVKKKKCSINMDSKSNPFDLKSNFYYILAFDIISESPYDRSI